MKKALIIMAIVIGLLAGLSPFGTWYAEKGFKDKKAGTCMTAANLKKLMLSFDEASEIYHKIIKVFPKGKHVDDATYFLAFCLERDDQTKPAISAYRTYIEAFPSGKHTEVANKRMSSLVAVQNVDE